MIANRLCTLAMCGVSRGRGPEKQAPSTLQFSFNSTEHNSLGHPGSSHAELCASRRPPCIPPPSPCPPAPGSPPGWPAALLTSCSGHLLEPSIPRQQHSLSASHGASSPLLKGSAGVHFWKWAEEGPPESMAASLAASTGRRWRAALAPPGRSLLELHM